MKRSKGTSVLPLERKNGEVATQRKQRNMKRQLLLLTSKQKAPATTSRQGRALVQVACQGLVPGTSENAL